ncbi:MAG: hypothetical protein ACK41X_07265 [Pseudorhodoplanes sp.]
MFRNGNSRRTPAAFLVEKIHLAEKRPATPPPSPEARRQNAKKANCTSHYTTGFSP